LLAQVPFARSSLNHDDVFILDTEKKIYQFNGANSNIQERGKALEVIQFLKEKYHEGTCDVAIVGKSPVLEFHVAFLLSSPYTFQQACFIQPSFICFLQIYCYYCFPTTYLYMIAFMI
jgi:hypothetical protein